MKIQLHREENKKKWACRNNSQAHPFYGTYSTTSSLLGAGSLEVSLKPTP